MKICSIVVTYNGELWVDKCFGSLSNSSIPDHKIIAIDNGSKDNTITVIKEKYPLVDIVINDENLGFGKANNIGIKKAIECGADYIFLLNQDAWVESDTIEKLISYSFDNKEYAILAPVRKNTNGKIEFDVLRNIVDKGAKDLLSDLFNRKVLKNVYNIDFIGAAAWLLTKETLVRVGGFDTIFFHYGEDNDYCKRTLLTNLKIGICPNCVIVHDTGEREIDLTMSRRKTYASVIFSLRYSNNKRIYNLLRYFYLSFFHKSAVLNKNKIRFNIKLQSSYFPL